MSLTSDPLISAIILKRPHNSLDALPHVQSIEDICTIAKQLAKQEVYFTFENKISVKERKYILANLKLLKKRKFEYVLQNCIKILKRHTHFIWAYIIAAAATRNCDKFVDIAPFYFSQALLINPNCKIAWSCLFKYYKNNINMENIIFETIFSGLLQTETNMKNWSPIVTELLKLSSESYFNLRSPLKILAPFIYSSDFENKSFLADAISQYIFNNIKNKNDFSEIDIGLAALKLNWTFDKLLAQKVLSYTILSDLPWHFNEYIQHLFDNTEIMVKQFEKQFFKKTLVFLSYYSPNSTNGIVQNMITIFRKLAIIRRRSLSYLNLLYFSFGDFRRTRDTYLKMLKKGRVPRSRDRIIYIRSLIKINNYELAWKEVHHAIKSIPYQRNKKRKPRRAYKRKIVINAFLKEMLHLLCHSYSTSKKKLGVLLCLKIMQINQQDSVELLFNASIGCIGLNEMSITVKLLFRLLKLGAINEIIFIKALMENSYPTQLLLLNTIQEFTSAHKLIGILAYKFLAETKASRIIFKSSLMASDYTFFYEWLGIYYYERGSFDKAEKFFELAVFYNPSSWISINYYSTLLSTHNPEASKLFLNVCSFANKNRICQASLSSLKAAMYYTKYKSHNMDYYKSCEHLRLVLFRKCQQKRYIKEMLGEAHSYFGTIGVGEKWFAESYIVNQKRHLNAGCWLGRQYLFKKGTKKYLMHMRDVICKSGLETFIALYNSAHAFLLRSIKVSLNNKHHLAQIYCQQALIVCIKALNISQYACVWKLMGDIFYQCASLKHTAGFLYIPHWLFLGKPTEKIVLIRRFQLLLHAIRCYYSGLDTFGCEKMKGSLWTSIATAYRKISTFSSTEDRNKILLFSLDCAFRALTINIYDCLSWNLIGTLINQLGPHSEATYRHASLALNKGIKLSRPFIYNWFLSSNVGFLSLSHNLLEEAYMGFLFSRGRCSTLDLPWFGQIFVHLLSGETNFAARNILFIYFFTNHFPTISILFSYLLFLSEYWPRNIIRAFVMKYRHFCGAGNMSFTQCLLSSLVNTSSSNYPEAKQDLIFALRTCNDLNNKAAIANYNSALYQLSSLLPNSDLQTSLLKISNQYVSNTELTFSLCEKYMNDELTECAYFELLKCLTFEKQPSLRKMIYLALSSICYEKEHKGHAKYYFKKYAEE